MGARHRMPRHGRREGRGASVGKGGPSHAPAQRNAVEPSYAQRGVTGTRSDRCACQYHREHCSRSRNVLSNRTVQFDYLRLRDPPDAPPFLGPERGAHWSVPTLPPMRFFGEVSRAG